MCLYVFKVNMKQVCYMLRFAPASFAQWFLSLKFQKSCKRSRQLTLESSGIYGPRVLVEWLSFVANFDWEFPVRVGV